jgi:hypothetical protein
LRRIDTRDEFFSTKRERMGRGVIGQGISKAALQDEMTRLAKGAATGPFDHSA